MPLENSPSTELYKDGLPAQLPDANARHRRFRLIELVLLLVILGLGLVSLFNSPLGVTLRGTGALQGRVSDDLGRPLPAQIFILGTSLSTQTDPNGSFQMAAVPSGAQNLVATYRGTGVELKVNVQTGSTVDVGEIRVVSTALPPP